MSNIEADESINYDLDSELEYALKNPDEALKVLKKLVPEYKKLN